MPLIKSGSRAAVGSNIEAEQEAGKPHKQAIAIALNNARKYGAKFADGGVPHMQMGGVPWTARSSMRELMHEGFIHSPVPGRTDKLPITVEGGAYVVPAQHVAAIGQDNSLAGASKLDKMFRQGPYGMQTGALHPMKSMMPKLNMRPPGVPRLGQGLGTKSSFGIMSTGGYAPGGVPQGGPVKIIAAGGEYVISPRAIREKFGDVDKGHKILDHWITTRRKEHAKTIANLKPPKKD